MAKLTIIAAVSGSYRRGGQDLSSGRTVVIDEEDINKEQLKSLKADPRVTITEAKAGDKSKVAADEKRIAKELKDAKAEATQTLKPFKDALTAAKKAGGKNKSPEQIAAIKAAQAELETAQAVHDDAVKEAETAAADERKQLGLGAN